MYKELPHLQHSSCTPAIELWRQCRAFQPWPGFFTIWRGRSLKLLRAEPLASRQGHAPGTVFDGPSVACGTGALRVLEVQLEGRRAMGGTELLRGYPALASAKLA